ncbi:MAG TPA: tryptophan--tRNA ligase [Firmicutes bacterium]|jgi:tryptophanyl-tRNA synthetase|nr:tryptophan--tRNA ligase [Bacillota bacterium]HBL51386.1 tryptophan--tRNA ligase [Bacillota bacterium]HCF90684.1 tryptophan--tRNA ligase [Bacillota bacterium]HCM17432.1 tryptophan--tRNA ligase [Bacillota bacterium]
MAEQEQMSYGTFEATLERSKKLEQDLQQNPAKYKVLTGDRPTGRLHIGHLFGSIQNRVRLHKMGVPTFIVIADYQVLTDRDTFENIADNIQQLTIDYLAAGMDLTDGKTFVFPHSHVPELNQLLLPFLTLVTNAELDRNPTVKEEILASGQKRINAGMYTYPVHQAADILFCKGTVVPVGKDQLPHLELTRTIARRFNDRFAKNKPVFPEPQPLLSQAPIILGLDGSQKMSKSRNNTIMLSTDEDETAQLIKKAKTDSERTITYDPDNRPEVANLLLLISLATGRKPEEIAAEIGDAGSGLLKKVLTESLNEYLRPLRARRKELEQNMDYVRDVLRSGVAAARAEAVQTLEEVREVMNMTI